jgi:hypothetical protein
VSVEFVCEDSSVTHDVGVAWNKITLTADMVVTCRQVNRGMLLMHDALAEGASISGDHVNDALLGGRARSPTRSNVAGSRRSAEIICARQWIKKILHRMFGPSESTLLRAYWMHGALAVQEKNRKTPVKMRAVIEIEFQAEEGFQTEALEFGLERGRLRLISAIQDGVLPGVSTGVKKGSVRAVVVTKLVSLT